TLAQVVTGVGNATLNNETMKIYVDAQDTLYNASMKTYVDSQDHSGSSNGTDINVTGIFVSDLLNCDTINTTASGELVCGNDGGAAATVDLTGFHNFSVGKLNPQNITYCGDGQIYKMSGGVWACSADNTGTGDISTMEGIYGEMVNMSDGGTVTPIAALQTWTQVIGYEAGNTNNVTFDEDRQWITIDGNSGVYEINWHLSFAGGSSDEYWISPYLNNATNIEDCEQRRKLGTGGDVGSASGHCFAVLNTGQNVSLKVYNNDAAADITSYAQNLNVKRLVLGLTDTDSNASTACSDGEYLDGNGLCINFNNTVDTRAGIHNASLKAYVDAQDIASNTSLKAYVDAQDILANTSLKAYVDSLDHFSMQQINDSIGNWSLDKSNYVTGAHTTDTTIGNCSGLNGCGRIVYDNNVTFVTGQTVGGEASGTIAAIVLDHDALDDQYYDAEGDLTALLDDDYVDVDESPAAADIAGTFSGGLTINNDAIDDAEMDYAQVTLNDFTDDVGFLVNGTDIDATRMNVTGDHYICKSDGSSCFRQYVDSGGNFVIVSS
ncbi:MAG: hypothetical protein GOV02_03810, partial [Candidatus Aenigmarchaeota archaeon]|nr:hypothetical protein [Candidatus Aenigmarchaeota archaeon]